MSTSEERPRQRSRRRVRVTDPGALRALTHPARLTVVDELYQGVERTATQLGELTGLTASAMSYHLRALERWGVVERAPARGDARERPWRAAGRMLSIVTDSTSRAAGDVIVGGALQNLRDEIRRWAFVEEKESAAIREAVGLTRSILWLSDSEIATLSSELRAAIDKYSAGRDADRHPEGSRRVTCLVAIVPTAPEA
jgi:DNA-binding transcriptional ArsR family regulator